jgi:translation initiation factor 2-alpha kinase 4
VKLHVKYCNTYPRAPALFAIQQPTLGLTPDHISKLTKYLREESLRLSGSEMVLEVCADFVHDLRIHLI